MSVTSHPSCSEADVSEPQTVLAAAIVSTSATTCTVGDVLGFPSSGTFVVAIDSERMLVGAGAGTTIWSSITRGHQATTAATHLIGATVTLVSALVTTPAGAADSYLSVAEADALATDDLGPEAAAWGAALIGTKEKALRRATRELDGHLGSRWAPYTWGQALLFPRTTDFAGTVSAPVPYIPIAVKRATYEQAKFVLKNASVIDAEHTRQARGMVSASEPNTSYSREDAVEISPGALKYLAAFVPSASARGMRSVRMGSGYQG
jgi:hypothetical protein